MLKYAALAALAVAPMLATAAHAEGYYVYSEIESDWSGNEYDGSELKTRVGYEHDLTEDTSVYVEVGPQLLLDNGEDADTRLAVEVGGDTMLTEDLKLYGEVEMVTGPQNDYGTKVGVKYFF